MPLWPLGEQALLRRQPQGGRISGAIGSIANLRTILGRATGATKGVIRRLIDPSGLKRSYAIGRRPRRATSARPPFRQHCRTLAVQRLRAYVSWRVYIPLTSIRDLATVAALVAAITVTGTWAGLARRRLGGRGFQRLLQYAFRPSVLGFPARGEGESRGGELQTKTVQLRPLFVCGKLAGGATMHRISWLACPPPADDASLERE